MPLMITSRYPVGISTEFCFRWQKKSSRWEGEGEGENEKKLGKKLKEEMEIINSMEKKRGFNVM